MADSDKNIRITTNKNKATVLPNIVFTGASAGTSVLTLEVRDDNTVAFTGADGDVFSLDYNLSTGTIWSVNDKSGTPLLRASAGGTIGIAELGSGVIVGIGQTNPKYKLDVQGWVGFASTGDGSYTILVENGLTTGNNALSIRAANALRFYNSGNTLYTGFIGAQSGVNTTYILPPRTPTGTGTSFLSSGIDGVMAWVAPPSGGGGSGSVNSGTATYAAFYATTTNAVSENANLQFTGTGVSVGGNINSSSTTSGSLYVRGGFGITGNAFIGGTAYIPSTTPSNISNLLVSNSTVSTSTSTGALVVTGGVGIGGSLYTSAGSTSSVSGVLLQNGNVSATTYNKLTLTAPAATATLTLANNSTLATSGANSLTLTTTAASNVTFPTAGTLTTTGNDLSVFAATTSLQLKNLISDETGSGALVFATSPDFTTSVTTSSGTFSVFNTNATNVSAFGAATTLSIGAATGKATINSTDNSISTTTGAFVVTGGSAVGQSLSVGGRLQMFNGANYTAFVSSASGNITYTLPPTAPSGTGTSFLSASTTGVMAWVAAPTSGGPSGTINSSTAGKVAYYSGSTTISGDTNYYFDYTAATGRFLLANADTEAVPNSSTLFLGVGTGATNFTVTGFRKTLAAFITNNAWTDGDLLVLGVAGAGTTQKFAVDWRGYTQIGAPGTGFTLPVTNGTSGQVLTANTNGVASWTTVTGSSGAGSGTVAIPGAQYQIAGYYWSATGASVSGSTTLTNNTATGVVDINHTTESTSISTGALVVDGGAGIAKSLFVGTTLSVGAVPGYNIPNNLGSFVSTVNSYNQLVIQNKSNGTSASANLVVNNDQSTDAIFYGELGINSSTFSGTGALGAPNAVYVAATSGPLVLGTTTQHPIRFTVNGGATDVMYISEGGTAISVFTNLGMRSASDLRFWNSGNTFYAAFQGGNNTASYIMTLPTAPVGAGSSLMVIGSDSNMYFVPPGAGIAFSNAVTNVPAIRAKRPLNLQFCSGYTPTAAGADTVVLRVPESPSDGTTVLTYNLRRFQVRVETPSAGSSRLQLERSSTDTGVFTLAASGSSHIGGLGVTITGAGIYLTSVTTFSGSLVTSGNLLRLNWTLLNATHANYSVNLLLEEV